MYRVAMMPSARLPLLTPRGWILAAMALFLMALTVQYLVKISDPRRGNRSAIQRWQPQLLGLEQGEDISKEYQYPNPPVMSVLLLPLAKLPSGTMAVTWYLAKCLMALAVMAWCLRLVDPGNRLPWWIQAGIVLLALRPIVGDLQHGNVNLFIFFIVMGGLVCVANGRSACGGVLLALAACCKVTPLLFLPYFVWKRDWRFVTGWVAGVLLFLWPGVMPSVVLGFEENQRNLISWYREMVHPFVVEGKVTSEHSNQSLPGVVFRLLTESPSFVEYPGGIFTPAEYHNILDLPPRVAKLITQAAMAAFGLLILWTCAPAANRDAGVRAESWPRLAAEWSLVLIGMLLLSERTWKHHAVTLALPWAVIVSRSWLTDSILARRWCVALSAVAVVGMWATSTGLLDDRAAKLGQVYGGYTLAFLSLTAAVVVCLKSMSADHVTKAELVAIPSKAA
jgi:alpha-1,2-mannosyltransferase